MLQAMLVAPDADELAIISVVLQRVGHSVLRANDLEKALAKWGSTPLDLIVMCFDGRISTEKIHRLRAYSPVPFIVITDPINEVQHVGLLDAGVDLVIWRPFSARLLQAQTRALLRRSSGMPLATLPTLTIGNISLDPETRSVQIHDDGNKRLTQLEFRLLYTLMVHKGQIMSAQQLVERVWGYEEDRDHNLVRGLIRRLRLKIEPDAKNPRYLITHSGIGYEFSPYDRNDL